MREDAFREVVDLNLVETLLPFDVFGAAMTSGVSVNVSSMAADPGDHPSLGLRSGEGRASFVTRTTVPVALQRVQRDVTAASARRTGSCSGRSREDVPA